MMNRLFYWFLWKIPQNLRTLYRLQIIADMNENSEQYADVKPSESGDEDIQIYTTDYGRCSHEQQIFLFHSTATNAIYAEKPFFFSCSFLPILSKIRKQIIL